MMDIDEMIKTISQAGYLVKKGFNGGMRVIIPSCFLDVFHVKNRQKVKRGLGLNGP
jgi:hypothetical protein